MIVYRLRPGDLQMLQPGMIVQLSTLTFIVERYNLGVVSKIGNRTNMEDSYLICHDMGFDSILKSTLYVVIDGHGGSYCTKFLEREMLKHVNQEFKSFVRQNDNKLDKLPLSNILEAVFMTAFRKLDMKYLKDYPDIARSSGAVVVSVLIVGSTLYCINVGDSRAVLSREGEAIDLSLDHKVTVHSEGNRIKK